jgi:uncharacterized membrane protein YkvA (DUF1232 family)
MAATGVRSGSTERPTMSTLESRCLESFPAWLRTLGSDVSALSALLETTDSGDILRAAACALTYLTKSLDLIPDGLEDLGYLDDAFVVRVAAARVPVEARELETSGVFTRLASEAELIAEFLVEDYPRLEAYVDALASSSARGRSVEQVVANPEVRSDLSRDVRAWAESYSSPSFLRDQKNLVKLRSFMKNRLP